MNRVTIYTDGSCHGNPGRGGYAAILLHNGKTQEVHGSDWYTTNNRMELKAVIEGLRMLTQPRGNNHYRQPVCRSDDQQRESEGVCERSWAQECGLVGAGNETFPET